MKEWTVGRRLTAGVEDVVNLLQGQALGCRGAAADLNNVRDAFEGNKALRRRGRVGILGDANLPAFGILKFKLEDAVGLELSISEWQEVGRLNGKLTPGG
jgi:hypothetical protein